MVYPTLWAGENWSRIAGAGRSHGVDTEHDNLCILYGEMDKVDSKPSFGLKCIYCTNAEKYSVFCSIFLMSGNDQYGRRLLLWGDTAEIFGFTFDTRQKITSCWKQDWTLLCCPYCSRLSTILFSIVTPDCRLDSGSQYCSILYSTTFNNS